METEGEFNRYTISGWDFDKALRYAKEAEKLTADNLVYEALLSSAIVSYCRPFSGNHADETTAERLTIEEFSLSEEEVELHDLCKTLRNEGLAHSQASKNRTGRVGAMKTIAGQQFQLLNKDFKLHAFLALVQKLANICDQRRGDYATRSDS